MAGRVISILLVIGLSLYGVGKKFSAPPTLGSFQIELLGEMPLAKSPKDALLNPVSEGDQSPLPPLITAQRKNESGQIPAPSSPASAEDLLSDVTSTSLASNDAKPLTQQPNADVEYTSNKQGQEAFALLPKSNPAADALAPPATAESKRFTDNKYPVSLLPVRSPKLLVLPASTPIDGLSGRLPAPSKSLQRLSISGGGIYQQHLSSHCDRQSKESATPGFYLRTQYQYPLKNRFYALAAVQYNAFRSQVTHQSTTESTALNNLNQVLYVRETTYYKLYNQYNSIDLSVGLGKTWSLAAFELALEGSVGRSEWLHIDGHYINAQGDLQAVSSAELVRGSWLGRVTVSAQRQLLRGLSVGVSVNAQTPVRLSRQGASCQPSILPLAVGCRITKTF